MKLKSLRGGGFLYEAEGRKRFQRKRGGGGQINGRACQTKKRSPLKKEGDSSAEKGRRSSYSLKPIASCNGGIEEEISRTRRPRLLQASLLRNKERVAVVKGEKKGACFRGGSPEEKAFL